VKALIDGALYCAKCKQSKNRDEFHKDSSSARGATYYCKECANATSRKHHARRMKTDRRYKESKRESYLRFKYGIGCEEYEELLSKQDHTCAVCGKELKSRGGHTHLDHDHITGKIRGMLCTNCNRGIGHLQESITVLEAAVVYLKEHNNE